MFVEPEDITTDTTSEKSSVMLAENKLLVSKLVDQYS